MMRHRRVKPGAIWELVDVELDEQIEDEASTVRVNSKLKLK